MTSNFLPKCFLLLLIGICSGNISARMYERKNRTCESVCPLFDCGNLNVQVQAGIAPVIWSHRGDFSAVSSNVNQGCPDSTLGNVVPLFELPSFSKFFKLPWTVGGKIGYDLCDHIEVFVEGNYRQASGKDSVTVQPSITLALQTIQAQFVFNSTTKYSFWDVYVGARYYFDTCWCSDISLFVGPQVGVLHHKKVETNIAISSLTNTCGGTFNTGVVTLFNGYTSVAAGANFGAQYALNCVCNDLFVVFTVDILAANGAYGNQNIDLTSGVACNADQVLPELKPSNLIVGNVQTEVFFPITLGLRYNF